MFYRSLYEYFRDVVLQPEIHVLEGEELKSSPTQREASEALKTLWTKLGGTVVSLMLAIFPVLAALPPETKWADVPPETLVTNVLDGSSGGVTPAQAAVIAANTVTNDVSDWALSGKPFPQTDLSSRTTFEQSTNIVTGIMSKIRINGQQLSEDVSITTFAPFKSTWTTGSGINQFFASVARDSDAKDGTAFLGQLSGSSTPWGSGNCEATLQVMKNTHGSLIYVVSVYSTDISPYYWFNMSVSGGSGNGWRSFDPAGTTVSKTALQGQTFDFSTMNGVYSGLKAVIEKMGGTVVNAPTND